MWPKLLAQLIPQVFDLLPHLRRVVPMAEKFLSSRSANEAALVTLAENVRGNLGEVSGSNTLLAEKIDALGSRLETLTRVTERAGADALAADNRARVIEQQVRSLRTLLLATLVMVVLLVALVAWLVFTRAR